MIRNHILIVFFGKCDEIRFKINTVDNYGELFKIFRLEVDKYLKPQELLKERIKKYTEIINTVTKDYHQFLLDQGFVFTTEQDCYYWTNYLAIHNTFIDGFNEYGRDYYNKEEGLELIPDWAIIEITKEVYNHEPLRN